MSHDRDEDALFPNFLLKSSFGGDWEGHALPESLKKNAEKKKDPDSDFENAPLL